MQAIYVSFFTPAYRAEADELIKTLDRFELLRDVRTMDDQGDWTRNCAQKPAFIREMIRYHPRRAIVWLDADARVLRTPDIFDALDCDVAFHLRNGRELLSGTLYFQPTIEAIELLDEWLDRCERQPERWDQLTLHEAIRAHSKLRISYLPESYTYIFDSGTLAREQITILHTQASRRLKHAAAAAT